MAKDVLGKESKVLFLTDAGSEYLNHKDLR
jgi:hypothetical protein